MTPDEIDAKDDHDQPCCGKCGSYDVTWEQCWHCYGDGEFDLHEDDSINYAPGEEYEQCSECRGVGGYQICHACIKAFNAALASPGPASREDGAA
jgi:hypothetical protein